MRERSAILGRWRSAVLLLLLACSTVGQVLAQPTPDQLFASASPAVVKLMLKDDNDEGIGTGSGFILAVDQNFPGGKEWSFVIVSNYHVIYPAVRIDAVFQDGTVEEVRQILAEDSQLDIAILGVWRTKQPRASLALCPATEIPIGTKVYTIGSPLGLTNSLSEGLVSGYRERESVSRWMQITAPISAGSSGGPVLSADGCILGITTATTKEGQNVNFATPASDLRSLLGKEVKARAVWVGASLSQLQNPVVLECAAKFSLQEKCPTDVGWPGECFDEAILRKVNSGDQQALLLAALGWEPKPRTDEEKNEFLKRAASAPPGDFSYLVHFKRAMAILDDGRKGGRQAEDYYPQAISALVKSRDLKPDFAPTRYELGFMQYIYPQQQYPEALLEADAVVRLVPRSHKGYMLRGAVWAKLGRREAFERDFDKAIDLRPKDYWVHEWKASGYDDLGDVVRAIEVNRRAIELADNEFSGARHNIINQLATVGQCEDAFEHFQKARLGEFTPDNPWALQILKCRARAKQGP